MAIQGTQVPKVHKTLTIFIFFWFFNFFFNFKKNKSKKTETHTNKNLLTKHSIKLDWLKNKKEKHASNA